MKITEVRINKFQDQAGNSKAYANITFDGCFVVSGLKVMDGKNGLWVTMPNRKKPDGTWADICFPITKEFRQEMQEPVLKEYGVKEDPKMEQSNDEDLEDEFPFKKGLTPS